MKEPDSDEGSSCNEGDIIEGEHVEPEGFPVLDMDNIGEGLTTLGRTADGSQLVYLDLILPGLDIEDISVLENFVHLQKVELPNNKLTGEHHPVITSH